MANILPCPIGMENGEILDLQITSSSEQGPYYRAHQARLNNYAKAKNAGAWCPKKHDNKQWLQIDMGHERKVVQIATQVSVLHLICKKSRTRRIRVISV